ncbi:hypothetical protein SAMN05421805_10612 [Saccharopolyspora antimicrobica]|uniref:Uncharacterized protein n=1 Tax=Saccharopolyspora antimicrobica TaxID=455193 RepID=A0A1I5AUP4_9PSEU|nr:hypothetical protein ATL45_4737 [Saccharopolyspora antimicrobica]SFN66131.1 hypothetical protein SAMN05421805_10612 [Saccharopolyspora antimicrobica]
MLDRVSSPSLSVDEVKDGLKRLRQGHGLARPTALLSTLTEPVRAYLANGAVRESGSVEEVNRLVAVLRRAIEGLADDERLYVEVEFNLVTEHRYPTLTERQESLARLRKCAAKTVRRRADRALDTLAYLLLSKTDVPAQPRMSPSDNGVVSNQVQPAAGQTARWEDDLCEFWRLSNGSRIDIVCSEIPENELPEYATPTDRNYLRYAKFADLDTLIYLRTRFAQLAPTVTIRDFAPSEYYDTQADVLVVVGGPPWNAKYREFLPQLPFYFEPHPLGEDDPLVIPDLGGLTLGPRWTQRQELLEDLAVFTRLTLAQGTTVFLLGGCLTLGVLGSARCLLEAERGARSIRYVTEQVGDADFVLVTEARRIGGITDVTDLTMVNPLLLLARRHNEPFTAVVDNSDRYLDDRAGRGIRRIGHTR